jgi:transcription initiation factor TFIIIB Brf1 subunit/transcription initiation factor TFIIB
MSSVEISCPNCGEPETGFDTRFDVDGGICGQCGFVVTAESVPMGPLDDEVPPHDAGTQGEWIAKARDSSEEALIRLLVDLDRCASDLLLSKTELDRTSELLVEVWKRNLLHGRKKENVIGAVLIISLRELENPRPIGLVANTLGVERVSLQRTTKKILRGMSLSLGPPLATQYLSFIGMKLSLDKETISAAEKVIDQPEMIRGDPATTAAAALYLVAKPRGEPITFDSAGSAAGSTKETVWRRAKLLRDRQSHR